MEKVVEKISLLIIILLVLAFSLAFQELDNEKFGRVSDILDKNCSVSGCHRGEYPPKGLNLEKDKFLDSVWNVSSQEVPSLELVDKENPEESYLLMKVKGSQGIKGARMPAHSPPLSPEDIQAIEDWIHSLQGTEIPMKKRGERKKIERPTFWGTRIINLPTSRSIGKGRVLFRVSHRFFPSARLGYDVFYGLDGPASILLSLGYGITENMSITLARANVFKEFESTLRWKILKERNRLGCPFSLTLVGGGSLMTQSVPQKSIFRSQNFRFHFQTPLAYRVNDSLSFLLSPGYSTNTDPSALSSRGTLFLGSGLRYRVWDDFSVLLEWIPVLSGYTNSSWGWGLGWEWKVGGHVFQVFAVNSTGITTPQFVPGGNLQLKNGDFRLGFNIFRWF